MAISHIIDYVLCSYFQGQDCMIFGAVFHIRSRILLTLFQTVMFNEEGSLYSYAEFLINYKPNKCDINVICRFCDMNLETITSISFCLLILHANSENKTYFCSNIFQTLV